MGQCCQKKKSLSPQITPIDLSLRLRDTYAIGKLLGEGSYGEVRFCTHKVSGEARAVKFVKRGEVVDLGDVFKEFHILKSLDHPNVVRLYEFYEEEE